MRNFFACASGLLGITPGWVDQHHQVTDGQEIEISGLPAGAYVLVSTVNVGALVGAPVYEEEDITNNPSTCASTSIARATGTLSSSRR